MGRKGAARTVGGGGSGEDGSGGGGGGDATGGDGDGDRGKTICRPTFLIATKHSLGS